MRVMLPVACAALMALISVGCARFAYVPLPPPTPEVTLSAQYRPSPSGGRDNATYEVYLSNTTTGLVTFSSIAVNDIVLPAVTSPEWAKLQGSMKAEGAGNLSSPLSSIAWWQFYPSSNVAPGETTVLQVHLTEAPDKDLRLVIADSRDKTYPVGISRFQRPQHPKAIKAITFTKDYRRVFAQYESGRPQPTGVWVNNREVTNYRILKPPVPGRGNVLAFDAPVKIANGTPLHVKIPFNDGAVCETMVRAFSGMMLDAFSLRAETDRKRLGLDKIPPVELVKCSGNGDVACGDVTKHRFGAAVPEVIAERLAWSNATLTAVHYCITASAELCAIYGPAVDAVLISPYSLSHGHDVTRLMENEERHLKCGAESVRPRPWLWIPDVFKRQGRFLEPAELDVMAWMALVQGCKGIKYFRAYDTNGAGFASCPVLEEEIVRLNREVREQEDVLSPLIPISEELVGKPETGVKLYTAWAGDKGLLMLVRNLDYATDGNPNGNGTAPRFRANPKEDLRLSFLLPEWLAYRDVRDAETGKRLVAVCDHHHRVHLTMARLDSYSLLWIANTRPGSRWWNWWRKA